MRAALCLLLALLLTLCACAPEQAQAPEGPGTSPSSAQAEPVSQPEPDGPRPVAKPAHLLGEPDEIVLFAEGRETALDKDTPEGQALLEALARRFPGKKLKIAACAFEWDREDGQGTDWQRMAEDFDFIRLSYNREQRVNIQCMAVPEGFPPEEREAVFSTMVFPLAEDNTGFWVDRECYGPLVSSGDTLAQLKSFFPQPAPSLEAVAANYPIQVDVPEKLGWYVQRITGDREGFLLMKHTAPNKSDGESNPPQVYYCQGKTGSCTPLPVEGADRWGIRARRLEDGTLRVVNNREVYRWRMGQPGEDWELLEKGDNPERTRLLESAVADGYSYNQVRDTACWKDDRGHLLYGGPEGIEGRIIWDCGWPEPPYHTPGIAGGNPIEKWVSGAEFSESGRLAFFCESNYGYQFHPVLYDLDTGNCQETAGDDYWLAGQLAGELFTGETVAIAGHRLTEEHPASDKLLLLTLEGEREITLPFSYTRAETDAGRLFLEAENGDIHEWDPEKERCVYRSSKNFVWNGNVKVEKLLVEDGYEAIRLSLGSASTLVLQPR